MPQGIARDGATGEEPFNQDWGDIGLKPGRPIIDITEDMVKARRPLACSASSHCLILHLPDPALAG